MNEVIQSLREIIQDLRRSGFTYSPLQWDYTDACDINNISKQIYESMNERETETDFHSQFEIAELVCVCVCECECVEELLANSTQSRLAAEAARLTGCKAISLFGNTVVSVCGLELTPEQLSHAKCSTITKLFVPDLKPHCLLDSWKGGWKQGWETVTNKRRIISPYERSIATSLKTTEELK